MDNPFHLHLSHWSSPERVFVPAEVAGFLKSHHFGAIRFLYKCYVNKGVAGVVVNGSEGMDFPLQIAAFLNALRPIEKGAIVVVAEDLSFWYYNLVVRSNWDVKLEYDSTEEHCIFLVSSFDDSTLKKLQDKVFGIVIIDEFEKVAKKTTFKKLDGRFKVGLSTRNFIKNPDQRLQWNMLRWSNGKQIGTFESFCESDNEHLENLTEPFAEYWYRITWDYCGNFKRATEEETELYRRTVLDWLENKNIKFLDTTQNPKKALKRKTKATSKENPKKGKQTKIPPKTESQSSSSSDASFEDIKEEKPVSHQLPSMELSPIVQSIKENLCRSPVKEEKVFSPRSDDILSFLFESDASNKEETEAKQESRSGDAKCDNEEFLAGLFD